MHRQEGRPDRDHGEADPVEKQRRYPRVRWGAASVRVVMDHLATVVGSDNWMPRGGQIVYGNDIWTYDTTEEWLAEYDKNPDGAGISNYFYRPGHDLGQRLGFTFGWTAKPEAWSDKVGTTLSVNGPDKQTIERIYLSFESASAPQSVPATVFIGHGRSGAWRELAHALEKRFDVTTIAFD